MRCIACELAVNFGRLLLSVSKIPAVPANSATPPSPNQRNMADKLTALKSGLALIYGTFLKYAACDEGDDPTTISKKELCKMIAEQLPHIAGNDMAEKVMAELDEDQDGTLNFLEYCSLITSLSMILHIVVTEQLSQ